MLVSRETCGIPHMVDRKGPPPFKQEVAITDMVDKKGPSPFKRGMAIPAHFVNTFLLYRSAGNIRIALGESVSGDQNFHIALAMAASDAKRLAHALLAAVDTPVVKDPDAQEITESPSDKPENTE